MLTTIVAALGGAGGLGALLTPWLVHVSARRVAESARDDRRDRTIAELWDYVLDLRYWMVKGCVGQPPTMPEGLSIADVRSRMEYAA